MDVNKKLQFSFNANTRVTRALPGLSACVQHTSVLQVKNSPNLIKLKITCKSVLFVRYVSIVKSGIAFALVLAYAFYNIV